MLVKEFLGVIYRRTNLRIIGGIDEKNKVIFQGVRDDIPEDLNDRKILFIDADLRTDFNDMYVATAGIAVYLK